ncbi:alpha/beta hydrolase [Altererythrobacter xixiisoli]|uniref:Alpha/beta hydrolase n=1 Tax=Croceibacterium xixiisoli TaxID=1476466 RepID=A0A6I4U066_9SPHN|nr:alpha/beta hydrolase-fold protein [Croceibacterium xixiisoli]MXP00722.1 alpha/beta hydrolase [Croceibacterium xixiisoli]
MPRRHLFAAGLSLSALAGIIPGAQAQTTAAEAAIPAAGTQVGNGRFERAVGPTIVNRGSELYSFSSFKIDSADGQRHYWVQIAVPKRAAPARGYPVLYMVDGNAAMGLISDPELEALYILSPPVLVAIGYDTAARVDTLARAYDYTPPVIQDGKPIAPVVRGRPGGGADIFAHFIEQQIKPRVEAMAKIDRQRQTLWGHSFGGLFTLYTLRNHPEFYQRYAAGDASLWYHDGELVSDIIATPPHALNGRVLRMMSGGGRDATRTAAPAGAGTAAPTQAPPSPATPQAPRQPDTSRGVPRLPDATERVVAAFGQAGAQIEYRQFPGLSHGEMMRASLIPALMLAARPDAGE